MIQQSIHIPEYNGIVCPYHNSSSKEQNYRTIRMAWIEKDHNDHLFSIPLSHAGLPTNSKNMIQSSHDVQTFALKEIPESIQLAVEQKYLLEVTYHHVMLIVFKTPRIIL